MTAERVYEINGEDFSTMEEFFEVIGRVLIPGASWGHNLDSFNDILRGRHGTPEGGFTLRWLNSAVSRQSLGHAETARQLEIRLTKCHPSWYEDVTAQLEAARLGTGETVFDWLVEIIEEHGEGGSEGEDGITLELA